MPRKRTRRYVEIECAWSGCSQILERPYVEGKLHFCNQAHYWAWRRDDMTPDFENTKDELLNDLQRATNLVGHLPTVEEYLEYGGQFTYKKFYTRFGSWQVVLSCIRDPNPSDPWDVSQVSIADGHWLAGLADGESTFHLTKAGYSYTPVWGLQLRADDIDVLREVRRILGLEQRAFTFWHRDRDRARGINAGDAVRFYIRDVSTHASRTLPFFEQFRLRSKKAREFEIFAKAVRMEHAMQSDPQRHQYTSQERELLREYQIELKNMKSYEAGDEYK